MCSHFGRFSGVPPALYVPDSNNTLPTSFQPLQEHTYSTKFTYPTLEKCFSLALECEFGASWDFEDWRG